MSTEPKIASLKTLQRQPSSNDVARIAGVSNATVSYVFNGRRDGSSVSPDVRERVMQAARELGYQPNRTARALKTGRTHAVAVWVASLFGIYPALVRQLQRVVEEDEYEIIVTGSQRSEPLNLNRWPVDGILAVDKLSKLKELHWRTAYHPPMVSVGVFYTTVVDHVGIDLYTGVLTALAHLEAIGRSQVTFVTDAGTAGYSQSLRERFPGTQKARDLMEHGMDPRFAAYVDHCHLVGQESSIWRITGDTRIIAKQEIQKQIQSLTPSQRPDALLCFNDIIALGAMAGLREAGLSIPTDIAVIGCDGIEDGEFHDPPLSTIVQPSEEMATLGWQYLRRRLQEPDVPLQSTILLPRFIDRGSTQ